MENMLNWATRQINRDKLQIIYSANSTAWVEGQLQDIDDRQAFERLGAVTAVDNFDVINPNQKVDLRCPADNPLPAFNLTAPAAHAGPGLSLPSARRYYSKCR